MAKCTYSNYVYILGDKRYHQRLRARQDRFDDVGEGESRVKSRRRQRIVEKQLETAKLRKVGLEMENLRESEHHRDLAKVIEIQKDEKMRREVKSIIQQ